MHFYANFVVQFGLVLGLTSAAPYLQSSQRSPIGQLFLTDTGVGHRSRPVTRWRTSLRGLTVDGTLPIKLLEFGDASDLDQPIGSTSLTIDHKAKQLYTAIGNGIVRSDLDGSSSKIIVTESTPLGIMIYNDKLYWAPEFEGLIKRSNLDGSGVETLFNISQGMKYYSGNYRQSIRFASSLAVDEASGYLYWSSSSNMVDLTDDGSIRRIPLSKANGGEPSDDDVEVLVEHIQMPGQIRIVEDYLYWVEQGRWTNSATAIKRAKIPFSAITAPIPLEDYTTVISSENNSAFFEKDSSDQTMTLLIRSFAIDETSGTLWFAMMSDVRTMFGKIAQINVDGSGELRVINGNVTEIGVPVGLEYVSPK